MRKPALNTPRQQFCVQCSEELSAGSRFCENCGQTVEAIRSGEPLPANDGVRRSARARSTSYNRQRIAWSLIFLLLILSVVFYIIYRDVGELNSDVWMSFGFFFLITIILAIYTLRKAGGTWRGELVEKVGSSKGIRLVFLTDQGKSVIIVADSRLADYFEIGDRVIKMKGYDYPEKIERGGKLQMCVACGNPYPITEKRCRTCRYPAIDPRHYL
jgi:hypothetical protein